MADFPLKVTYKYSAVNKPDLGNYGRNLRYFRLYLPKSNEPVRRQELDSMVCPGNNGKRRPVETARITQTNIEHR